MNEGGRTLAIVNPVAGGGAGKRLAATLARTFRHAGMHIEVEVTPEAGEAARMAREAADDGYDAVIAVGGDGTANEIANGLVGTSTALGLYPIGTGNDIARGLGYPRRDVAAFLAHAGRRRIDLAEANGRVFVNAAGMGIDGAVSARVSASAAFVGGRLGYLLGSIATAATYRATPMTVDIDGVVREGRHLAVIAANGPTFGHGMRVAPGASMSDGLLDVIVAGDLGPLAALGALARMYFGRHIDGRAIVHIRAARVVATPERPQPIEVDGEPGHASAFTVHVRPSALEVLAS